jgi:signal transduction histidine kinase
MQSIRLWSHHMVLGKTVGERIGGRWAISLIFYVLNLPINFVTIGSNMSGGMEGNIGSWFFIWAAGYSLFGVILLLANFTLFRNRRVHAVPIAWVVALGAIAGGSRGALVGFMSDALSVSGGGPELIAVRLVTGAILGAIFIPIGALIISVVATYFTDRSKLVNQLTQVRVERMRIDGETQVLRETLLTEASEQITSASSARTVSHQVWANTPQSTKARVPWFTVIRTAVFHNPYPGVIVAVLWSLSALGSLIPAIGFTRGIAQVVFSAIAIWGIYSLASRVSFSSSFVSLIFFVSTMAITVIVTGPVASIIFDNRPANAAFGLIVANSIWIPTLTIFVSIFRGALASAEEIVLDLNDQIKDEEINTRAAGNELVKTQQEVAEAIHGMASRIHTSQALTSAAQHLNFDNLLTTPDTHQFPQEIIESALTPWTGLIEIDSFISTVSCDAKYARDVKRVIAEGIANAYRHGGATSCIVSVTQTHTSLLVQVVDNGTGLPEKYSPGLGSAVFESVCGSEWRLEGNAGKGCTLRATVSLEH